MLKNLLLLLASLVVSLLVAEGALRLFTSFPIHGQQSNRIYDSRLLFRTLPRIEGVDESGFRNAGAKPPYDLVAIGDSHTFGFNVDAQDNWPSLVGKQLGQSVYNLSAGAYNIVQYLTLFTMAMEQKPRTIVIGFYPFNDLAGMCEVLASDYWRAHTQDFGLRADYCGDVESKAIPSWWEGVSYRFAIASAARHLIETSGSYEVAEPAVENDTVTLEAQSFRVRAPAHPPSEGEISDAGHIFSYMQSVARAQGVRLIVLFIPSEELILHASIEGSERTMPDVLAKSVQHEMLLRAHFMQQWDKTGIEYADALPYTREAFAKALQQHEEFYPPKNGHPREAGYRAYAQALVDYWNAHQALPHN